MFLSQKARLKKFAARAEASSGKSLYLCAQLCQVIKKMWVALGNMLCPGDGNGMLALQADGSKRFYQPVIRMRIKICSTGYVTKLPLDCTGGRNHPTPPFTHLPHQTTN